MPVASWPRVTGQKTSYNSQKRLSLSAYVNYSRAQRHTVLQRDRHAIDDRARAATLCSLYRRLQSTCDEDYRGADACCAYVGWHVQATLRRMRVGRYTPEYSVSSGAGRSAEGYGPCLRYGSPLGMISLGLHRLYEHVGCAPFAASRHRARHCACRTFLQARR